MAVAVKTQLQGYVLGQRLEELGICRRQIAVNLLQLLYLLILSYLLAVFGQNVVELLYQFLH